MSLWLALLWFLLWLFVLAVFILCRNRVAEITRRVDEEFRRHLERITDVERKADDRLSEIFLKFGNTGEGIRSYQKTLAEIPGIPVARPAWNWSPADLQALHEQRAAEEKAHRSRRPLVMAVLGIIGLAAAAAVVTVILSDTVSPVVAAATVPGGSAALPGMQIPAAVPPILPSAMPPVSTPYGMRQDRALPAATPGPAVSNALPPDTTACDAAPSGDRSPTALTEPRSDEEENDEYQD